MSVPIYIEKIFKLSDDSEYFYQVEKKDEDEFASIRLSYWEYRDGKPVCVDSFTMNAGISKAVANAILEITYDS